MMQRVSKGGGGPVSFLALAAALATCGCEGRDGPRRYEVSGQATIAGRPIPGGRILFVPDAAQGNAGPGSVAEIDRGVYRTRPGKGVGGGAYHVTILGTDGSLPTEPHDNRLFPPYETTVNLPRADCRHDFDVPAEGPG